jgi:hypothetical protein
VTVVSAALGPRAGVADDGVKVNACTPGHRRYIAEACSTSMQKLLFASTIAALLTCGCGHVNVPPGSSGAHVVYHNEQFDLTFSLPASWQGYSVLVQQWEGHAAPECGPMIILRHPLWKTSDPYQDIPILVFTSSQWEANRGAGLCIGAGGLEYEIGHNRKYAFAISSRFNADDSVKEWREATDAVERNMAANPPRLYPE